MSLCCRARRWNGFNCCRCRCRSWFTSGLRCHDSSRVSAMPTSRAYDTRYAIHPNMLTHDLHGPHAVIINMDLRVHGHVLYKRRHACSTTTNGCLGCYIKSTTWPQYKYGMPPRVHEHAGSGATHLSLVAHHPLSIDMLPHGLYVTRDPPIGVVLALY
eukprot:COSAG05_NODE_76_length_21413_cov_40.065122_6_plen_158_part_00